MTEEVSKSNADYLESLAMQEIGGNGLQESDGSIYEQVKEELRFPQAANTYKLMYNDPLIFAAINLTINMMAKVGWGVRPKKTKTAKQVKYSNFIEECMGDLEGQSWKEFIKTVLTMVPYGFSVQEKVFRRRTRKNGSMYNDNLVGWKKLAHRSQNTVRKWEFSDDGRELIGLYQDLSTLAGNDRYGKLMASPEYKTDGLHLKRQKFLLFRHGGSDNPEGHSPLAACYIPWRYKTTLEEHECIGVSRDLRGLPLIKLHPKYMSADASEADKKVYQYFMRMVELMNSGENAGGVIPAMYDDKGNALVDFSLMGVNGAKAYDTDKIIKRYEDKILTALFADILKLGHNTHGSFSLAGAKTNITAINIEARLQEIADVINNDLIPHTFALNGWDLKDAPEVYFEDLDEEDLDVFSKLIQRMGSVNYIPRTREFVAQSLKRAGFDGWEDILEMDEESFNEMFTDNEVAAARGMEEGNPSGTGQANSNGSATNSENA